MTKTVAKTTTAYLPERGDLVWVVLDPAAGHEQSGRRPAIVLSPRSFTEHTSLAIVCPVTTKQKGLPFEVAFKGSAISGAALPIHIKSLDVSARKVQYIEKAPPAAVAQLATYITAIVGHKV